MKHLLIAICLLLASNAFAQINFDQSKSLDQALYKNALSADSAIKAGDYGPVHSLVVVKNGTLVFENYYNDWPKDSLHQLQSATKSVNATLVGIAIQQGFIKSETDLISKYFPDYPIEGKKKSKIKISDLMTQRHGLEWHEGAWEDPKNSWRKLISEENDWYRRILELPMDTLPGTRFVYSNAAPTLVASLVQNAAKMPIDSFAIQYLFEPLDIRDYWFWQGNSKPQNNGMALISLTSRDMAKIGQLYLQKGKWNGKQILPESYISTATSAIVKNVGPNGYYSRYDYGYFWWVNPVLRSGKQANVFIARGAGGQNIIVNPDENLVVVTTAWNMQRPNQVQYIYDRHFVR